MYSHYEKCRQFWLCKGSNHQIDTYTVSKDKWGTKEDTGKSMKNTLYVLWYAKWHLYIKQWKYQARSLSHYQIMLFWRHQSVARKKKILNSITTFSGWSESFI